MSKMKRMILAIVVIAATVCGCSNHRQSINVTQLPQLVPNVSTTAAIPSGVIYYGGKLVNKVEVTWAGAPIEITPEILIPNLNAKDVSYSDVVGFLQETRNIRASINSFDENGFPTNGEIYSCGYYTENLYNLAGKDGIKAGVVVISSIPNTGNDVIYHAINVFNTIDKGLLFVDSSYYDDHIYPALIIGSPYTVFGFTSVDDNTFTIGNYEVYWAGVTQ